MQVHIFQAKVSAESMQQMEENMNRWLRETQVEPKIVKQTFCTGHHHEVGANEPLVLISVWY